MHALISFGLMIKMVLKMEKGMLVTAQIGLTRMIISVSCIFASYLCFLK